MIAYVGEDVEQGKHYFIASGNELLYNHSRNRYGGFSENWESTYLRTQQYHSWAYTQGILSHSNIICNIQNLEIT